MSGSFGVFLSLMSMGAVGGGPAPQGLVVPAWQQDLDGGGTYGDDASCGDLVPQEHQE